MCACGECVSDLKHLHNWWLWAGETLHQGHRAHLEEREREWAEDWRQKESCGMWSTWAGLRKQSMEGCNRRRGQGRVNGNRGANNDDKTMEVCDDCRGRQGRRGDKSRTRKNTTDGTLAVCICRQLPESKQCWCVCIFLRLALAGPGYIMHEILNSVLAKHFLFIKWLSQSAPSPSKFIEILIQMGFTLLT